MKRAILCAIAVSTVVGFTGAQSVVIMPDSTNNRVVTFDPNDGSLINSSLFAIPSGTTPIHSMQVGSEIWISEQLGDKVSRYDLSGNPLGAITGTMDNVRGMGMVGGTVYVTSTGTGNGAPGRQVRMFDTSGSFLGNFLTPLSSGFHVFAHQGDLLVSSDAANDDIHRYSVTGADIGTFHNSTGLNFAEQMDYDLNGNILVAGFSSNLVETLDPNSGTILNSFTASGARGVFQLGNGNVLWSSGTGVFVFNTTTGGSTQVYTGGGRFLDLMNPVPEPGTIAMVGLGLAAFARRRKRA